MDEFAYLEDLGDERTKRFVEEANREARAYLGGGAKAHFQSLLSRLSRDAPISLVGLGDSYALLYRSSAGQKLLNISNCIVLYRRVSNV